RSSRTGAAKNEMLWARAAAGSTGAGAVEAAEAAGAREASKPGTAAAPARDRMSEASPDEGREMRSPGRAAAFVSAGNTSASPGAGGADPASVALPLARPPPVRLADPTFLPSGVSAIPFTPPTPAPRPGVPGAR